MERDLKALQEDGKHRTKSRPPRPGSMTPGNAWVEYDQALDVVKSQGSGMEELDLFLQRHPKADHEKVRSLVATHAVAIELLCRGSRRDHSDVTLIWNPETGTKEPGPKASTVLAKLLAARVRFLVEEGKARDAVNLALDGCQFARDLGTDACLIYGMIALGVYKVQFDELLEILQSGVLTREDLLELEKGLEVADRIFPRMDSLLLYESVAIGYSGRQSPLGSGSFVERAQVSLAFWRNGCSSRLAVVEAFDHMRSSFLRASGIDDLSWKVAETLAISIDGSRMESSNMIVRKTVPGIMSGSNFLRERKAQLRILRSATAWRATGRFPDLEDPYGTKLLHEEKEGMIRVWSVGPDGVDNLGIGDWKPSAGKDIVLTWKR